jgi:hypothetical protein
LEAHAPLSAQAVHKLGVGIHLLYVETTTHYAIANLASEFPVGVF